MKLWVHLVTFVHVLLACQTIYALSSKATLSNVVSPENTDTSNCQPIDTKLCNKLYGFAKMPNFYGNTSSKAAADKVNNILGAFPEPSSTVVSFFCVLYLPPCSGRMVNDDAGDRNVLIGPLPCRPFCEQAMQEARVLVGTEQPSWQINCQEFPKENCFRSVGTDNIQLATSTQRATPTTASPNDVVSFAPLDVELGNEEGYEVEVVSISANHILERRYDIADLGDPDLFQGWADVQGTGAANDYCRVIGRGKRKFLSCNLAGNAGQGHHYVSKQGFEVGHPGTWFMRDMDQDGRDDYCRCVGSTSNTKMTCMKAGQYGFYGSPMEGGSQHTFVLSGSEGCSSKRFNPTFGESS